MVGIVIGDLALTVLLVSIAYHCASHRRRQKEKGKAQLLYLQFQYNPDGSLLLLNITSNPDWNVISHKSHT